MPNLPERIFEVVGKVWVFTDGHFADGLPAGDSIRLAACQQPA
jgi:hypothetical protein